METASKARAKSANTIDLIADGLEVFQEFLLLERVAVGGFTNHLQLIFDALQRGILLAHLVAEFAMLGMQLSEAVLNGARDRPADAAAEAADAG